MNIPRALAHVDCRYLEILDPSNSRNSSSTCTCEDEEDVASQMSGAESGGRAIVRMLAVGQNTSPPGVAVWYSSMIS
jgi:hypothetical protein